MRVLITGHEGFLGSSITQNFLNKGHNVIGIDSKKTNIFRNYKKFSGYKINLLSELFQRKKLKLLKLLLKLSIFSFKYNSISF